MSFKDRLVQRRNELLDLKGIVERDASRSNKAREELRYIENRLYYIEDSLLKLNNA